jgi:small subunit ribosomal protein S7
VSRRKAAQKRTIIPDPLFNSELISKFINCVMQSGKKSVAERIVYGALIRVLHRQKEKGEGDVDSGESASSGSGDQHLTPQSKEVAIKSFIKALDNVSPAVEVKSRRVGGSNYQVPIEVRPERRATLGMRWLIEYANSRSEKTMVMRLAGEILDALHGRGGAVKKREDVHRMAKANQAFAHYRW